MDELKEFELSSNEIDKSLSPFKELLKGEDVSNFVLKLSEEDKIVLKDTFRLKINIKKVGMVFFLLSLEDLDKEKLISSISILKDIKVKEKIDAVNKLNKLNEVVGEYKPLLVLYIPNAELISNEEFASISWNAPIFTYKPSENSDIPEEKESLKDQKSFKEKCVYILKAIGEFLSPIKKSGFYYLFITIASILIAFASAIAIFYCYFGNMLCVLFFICALAGAALSFFVFSDYTKKLKTLNYRGFYFLFFFIVIGIGIGVALYYVFYILQKELPESLTKPSLVYILSGLIAIGVIAITLPLSLLKNKLKKVK